MPYNYLRLLAATPFASAEALRKYCERHRMRSDTEWEIPSTGQRGMGPVCEYKGNGKTEIPKTGKPAPPSPSFSFPPSEPTIPQSVKILDYLPGSTAPVRAELTDSDGAARQVVLKTGGDMGGAIEEHARNECNADRLYEVWQPELAPKNSRLYEFKNRLYKATDYMQGGISLGDWWEEASPSERSAMKKTLQENAGLDALIGNWDVIGLEHDNILVVPGKDGSPRPFKIDNGGALGFRAQGKRKSESSWGMSLPDDHEDCDFWSVLSSSNNEEFYGDMDVCDIVRQIDRIAKDRRTPVVLSGLPKKDAGAIAYRLGVASRMAEALRNGTAKNAKDLADLYDSGAFR